jgi:aminoglycoside phosphotransferase (APT) family kinase protein
MTEAVDRGALARYLSENGFDGTVDCELIAGGRSNLTYRVQAGDRTLVLRRPPLGKILKGAHDVVREYRILRHLQGSGVPVAPAVLLCEDSEVLGAPFYLTGFIEGYTLRTWQELGNLSPGASHRVIRSFGAALARLHDASPDGLGLDVARADDYLRRQIHVWRRQVDSVRGRWMEPMGSLADRLSRTAPEQRSRALVHGDYRLDNVLFSKDGEALAVVDWELWTLGDPLGDVAAALTYWNDAPNEISPLGSSVTVLGDLGTRADLLDAYVAAGGDAPMAELIPWYLAYGLWRYAAILDGVYHRNRAEAYAPEQADQAWERYEHVIPSLLEIAEQNLCAHER